MVNVDELLNERGHTHGHFPEHANITQHMKDWMRTQNGWAGLTPAQREALDMIAHKIGRILAGNPHFEDHWADISGYSTLVEREIASRRDYSTSINNDLLTEIMEHVEIPRAAE